MYVKDLIHFIVDNTENSNKMNKSIKSKKSENRIYLPSLLTEKNSISQSRNLESFRDEIRIRNSPRKIDYENFNNYKDLKTQDLTFIKEKISYFNTENNSPNVKFPQSYLDLTKQNIEQHQNFIRKTTKIDLNNYKETPENNKKEVDVLKISLDSIDKLQNNYK